MSGRRPRVSPEALAGIPAPARSVTSRRTFGASTELALEWTAGQAELDTRVSIDVDLWISGSTRDRLEALVEAFAREIDELRI